MSEKPDNLPSDLIGRTIIVLIDPPAEYPIVADPDFDIHRNFSESAARQCLLKPELYVLKPLPEGERRDTPQAKTEERP